MRFNVTMRKGGNVSLFQQSSQNVAYLHTCLLGIVAWVCEVESQPLGGGQQRRGQSRSSVFWSFSLASVNSCSTFCITLGCRSTSRAVMAKALAVLRVKN